jgi:hypothetical protein
VKAGWEQPSETRARRSVRDVETPILDTLRGFEFGSGVGIAK